MSRKLESGTGSRALVVIADDEPGLLDLMDLKLTRAGFCTLTGRTGVQAELLIRHHRPRVAVLNVNMPERTGIEVTRRLQDDHVSTLIVLISAGPVPSEVDAGGVLAAVYLSKPFPMEELLNHINALIDS